MWLYCAPDFVTTLIRAPMPSRLLFVPCSLNSIQWLLPGLWLIQISAGALNALTTTSSFPSPFKSPTADPRCREGGCAVSPASAVRAENFIPPRFRKTVFGWAIARFADDANDCTCPRETKISFQPSLSKSAIVGEYPDIGRLSRVIPLSRVTSTKLPLPELR